MEGAADAGDSGRCIRRARLAQDGAKLLGGGRIIGKLRVRRDQPQLAGTARRRRGEQQIFRAPGDSRRPAARVVGQIGEPADLGRHLPGGANQRHDVSREQESPLVRGHVRRLATGQCAGPDHLNLGHDGGREREIGEVGIAHPRCRGR